ncbi:MAG: CoA transferase, partial [Dehalococcoidia bacterium]
PMEGIRVVDSTYVFALPYAAGLMADLGAEVIKIEGPGRIDTTRGGAFSGAFPDNDPGQDPWNRTANFNQINRGKKSLVLDLSREEGLEELKRLLKVSDIFMENFTPRVMRRWGLDWPNIRKIKPDIIMVSNTGYGHGEGPFSPYPAQATTQEATHGHTHITGYRGGIPSKAGQSYVDFLACWSALLGAANALRHRNRTGQGQWVDVGMYQLGVYTTSEYILDWASNGRLGERIGDRHPWRVPQGCYPCSGDNQWCVISVGDDEEWAALCRVMGKPELAQDSRFASGLNRKRNHDEIDEIIKEWTGHTGKFEVMEQLQGAGVPAGPVFDSRDTNLDKHYWSRGFLEMIDFPEDREIGKRVLMGRPWQASKMPVSIKGPGPKLGVHNREMLIDLLGHTEAEFKELEEAHIIAERPDNPRPPPTLTLDDLVKHGRLSYHDPEFKKRLGI